MEFLHRSFGFNTIYGVYYCEAWKGESGAASILAMYSLGIAAIRLKPHITLYIHMYDMLYTIISNSQKIPVRDGQKGTPSIALVSRSCKK